MNPNEQLLYGFGLELCFRSKPKFMKTQKHSLILLLMYFFMTSGHVFSQTISKHLIGNNLWLPPWMDGSRMDDLLPEIGKAGFQLIRIGGNGAQNSKAYTNERIADMIREIRNQGADVIVQVPHSHSADQAFAMIKYLNGEMKLAVNYWAIGNEPNLNNSHHTPIPVAEVAQYIKRIATSLKSYDENIKTIGPTTAWYDSSYLKPLFVDNGLFDISGKDDNGNYYIDILSWNKYQISTGSEYEETIDAAIKVISKINLDRPENQKMTWAITELNGHYDNNIATDEQKCWSFNTGQTFAELFGIGMRKGAFTIAGWSIFESGGLRGGGDLGLFDQLGEDFGYVLRGRSTYYHSLMLGKHMGTDYLTSTTDREFVTSIAMSDEHSIAVMLINRGNEDSLDYSIAFNGNSPMLSSLNVELDIGLEKMEYGIIEPKTTQMLIFDSDGNLEMKYNYSQADAENFTAPSITQFSNLTQ